MRISINNLRYYLWDFPIGYIMTLKLRIYLKMGWVNLSDSDKIQWGLKEEDKYI